MANIPTDPTFVPSLVFDDNTIVIKIYSPFGETGPGNYEKLQYDINTVSLLGSVSIDLFQFHAGID